MKIIFKLYKIWHLIFKNGWYFPMFETDYFVNESKYFFGNKECPGKEYWLNSYQDEEEAKKQKRKPYYRKITERKRIERWGYWRMKKDKKIVDGMPIEEKEESKFLTNCLRIEFLIKRILSNYQQRKWSRKPNKC